MITGQLKSDIDKLWETFWTGGISNPLTVIEQITYLLFIKRMDDIQLRKENKANRLGQSIETPIYTEAERLRKNKEYIVIQKLIKNQAITRQELSQLENLLFDGEERGTKADFVQATG